MQSKAAGVSNKVCFVLRQFLAEVSNVKLFVYAEGFQLERLGKRFASRTLNFAATFFKAVFNL